MTELDDAQLSDFDSMIDHGTASQCANFFDGVSPLVDGTRRRGGNVRRQVPGRTFGR